ncbi:GNAT family N-acetyltransferase [Falsarthrobacter nasiphocae]|uniref:GNAT family acetyltransferase n=1 Tax=Falsarthrobacter nasiphocae TaxID=189863 RepID=A0AAE3YHQ1_9MICC|nr:GNAT family N-acetyltransferase [Falsarthrobacter nasiphocae]MDR6891961.1 putative GNAT family acetyltransferase [Falsarthrobacter nasiphocae]
MSPTVENPLVSVGHQEGLPAFEIHVDGSGQPAGFTQFVDVEHDSVTQRIFPHTSVKDEFSGQGLASVLVKGALDQTIADGIRIVPVCPYVAAWLKRHEDYAEHADRVSTRHLEALKSAVRG